jgi:hypothetical protein
MILLYAHARIARDMTGDRNRGCSFHDGEIPTKKSPGELPDGPFLWS